MKKILSPNSVGIIMRISRICNNFLAAKVGGGFLLFARHFLKLGAGVVALLRGGIANNIELH